MVALLLVAYYDLIRYAIPLMLLGNVAYIYGNEHTCACVVCDSFRDSGTSVGARTQDWF